MKKLFASIVLCAALTWPTVAVNVHAKPYAGLMGCCRAR